ncbi:MAG: hypothetical protein Ct9H90mP16_20810 [Candidatus Poseidoniales archaeon]|nr:MAG: hypothetical protein Ct9H90mP16_20810 [Candidatus Poseidoniales archaeon]
MGSLKVGHVHRKPLHRIKIAFCAIFQSRVPFNLLGWKPGFTCSQHSLQENRSERFSLQFPAFLRRGSEAWRPSSIVECLAGNCGASEVAVREELWPALRAISSDGLDGDPENFDISLALGLSSSDHLALHGLRSSLKSSKELLLDMMKFKLSNNHRDYKKVLVKFLMKLKRWNLSKILHRSRLISFSPLWVFPYAMCVDGIGRVQLATPIDRPT